MTAELTNHLWQSTLFALAAGLLAFAFRKNRAQIRYWLWLSASLKFLVPFALLVSLGSHLGWAPAVKVSATQAVSFTMVQITQPFPDNLSFVPSTPHTTDWFLNAVLGVWACGFLAIAVTRFRTWRCIRATVRVSTRLEVPSPVEVRSSPGLLEPGVVGLFHPVLLLPEGIIEHLTLPQLDAILIHESCHIRRRDNLTAAIHMIVEAVFWSHPVVWWIGVQLVKERERACDEELLRIGAEPQVYAEGILSVCKFYVESPLTCVAGATGHNLRKRVELIMRNHVGESLNGWRKFFLTTAGAVALAVPIIFGLANATPGRAQSQAEDTATKQPAFEVASIKPHKPGYWPTFDHVEFTAVGFTAKNIPIQQVIVLAYDLHNPALGFRDNLITGGPKWIQSDWYDIEAKVSESDLAELSKLGVEQQNMVKKRMLQSLLAERFKLKVHRETKQAPAYLLVLAKNGPKNMRKEPDDVPLGGISWPDRGHGEYHAMPISALVLLLENNDQIPVIDETGLKGKYSFSLEWAPDPARMPPPRERGASQPDWASRPSIFAALQEQLGLKLVRTKAPLASIVIDHIERPSEN